ncbi:MAG: hypothetical protein AMXMBFR72_00370 [Betaproteobacteria bacterium]
MQRLAQRQIALLPPSGQRGQIVRRGGHQRERRKVRRRAKVTVGFALEVQQLVRQHAGGGERRADRIRHGAEVFTDHQAAVAMAFDRHRGQKLVERVMHVSALCRLGSRRDQIEPHQSHHVVDAQRAGVPHVRAQHRDERFVRRGAQRFGLPWRQPPVLPFRIEVVRRGADAQPVRVQPLLRPAFGAARIDRHRQIGVQAHGHVRRAFRRGGELLVGEPLQTSVEVDAFGVGRGERRDRGRIRIAILRRPRGPAPARGIARVKMLLQCLEQRVPAQVFAAAALEFFERQRAFAAHLARQQLEDLELRRANAFVVDQFGGAQPREARLEAGRSHPRARRFGRRELRHGLHVEIKRVEEQPARRAVRAAVPRIVRKQRVQRIQPHDVGTVPRGEIDHVDQVREIADAPVALRAQRVKLDRRPPDAAAERERRRQIAALGRDPQRRMTGTPRVQHFEPVITDRRHAVDGHRARDMRFAVDRISLDQRPVGRRKRAFARRAVLEP